MKNNPNDAKQSFTLLALVSVIAIGLGAYLGVTLGMAVQPSVTVLSAAGILLWALAWGVFLRMCMQLRRGGSAFTPATEKTLLIIRRCMIALAALTILAAAISLDRPGTAAAFIGMGLLPGVFLSAALAAGVLRGLLTRAMAIEEEQEGVV